MEQRPLNVLITIFNDSAKAEIQDGWRREVIGWFRDEVSAIGAVAERVIVQSAILPDLRALPTLTVSCEYRKMNSGHSVLKFSRATTVKAGPLGRRVVMLPGLDGKTWLPRMRVN